jgi:hypothetical protein
VGPEARLGKLLLGIVDRSTLCHAACTFLSAFSSFLNSSFSHLFREVSLSSESFLIDCQLSFRQKSRSATYFNGQLKENRPDSPVQRLIGPFLAFVLVAFLFQICTVEISYVDSVMISCRGSLNQPVCSISILKEPCVL